MSRTYRRKKGEKPGTWVTHKNVEIGKTKRFSTNNSIYYRHLFVKVPLQGRELKKSLSRYHSDGYKFMGSAPKWFVKQFCNRPFRARMKSETKRILKHQDYEDYSFEVYRNTAEWMWW